MQNVKFSLLVSVILVSYVTFSHMPITTSIWAEMSQSIEFDGQRAFEHLEQQMYIMW